MTTMILLLCTIAGYGISQPVLSAMRSIAATRAEQAKRTARSHATALRAIRTIKAR